MINPAHFDLQSLRVFLLAAEYGSLTTDMQQQVPPALLKELNP